MKKNKLILLITSVIVSMLLISNITIGSINQTEKNNDDITISKLNMKEKTFSYNRKPVTIPKKNDLNLFGSPVHDYDGDQSHPALAKSGYMGYMSAFKDENAGTIAWSANRGNTSVFEVDGGDYPSLKLWDETTFYGTFVPDANDSHGGMVYLFSTDFPENPSTYQLSGWDWSSNPDYPGEILWHDIIDIEISCNPSKEDWEWGFVTMIADSNFDVPLEKAPFITYQTSEDGYATITWYQIEGCEHTDNVIDSASLNAYSVYDLFNDETAPYYGLFIRQDNYADWDEEGAGYLYTSDGNLLYPIVSSYNDNIVIIAETDENENKDIVCFYGNDLENLETQVILETPEDERYPQIKHFEGETFIATYIKNGNLYGIQTDDAGQTWSNSWRINENDGEVIEEYASSDLSTNGILALWEERNEDLDLWMDAAIDNEIPESPSINAPEKAKPGNEIEITVMSTDPDGENVYYYVDYGDGVLSGWQGPFESGESTTFTHTWNEEELYHIKAKAKDENGLESDWSSTEITLPKTDKNPFGFLTFIKNFLDAFQHVRDIFPFFLKSYSMVP